MQAFTVRRQNGVDTTTAIDQSLIKVPLHTLTIKTVSFLEKQLKKRKKSSKSVKNDAKTI